MKAKILIPVLLLLCGLCPSGAKVVEYDLTIAAQTVSPAGKPVSGLTINGTIPGPVLRFTEGDWARIRVHNKLPHHSTSTHWHGVLLPNAQDGVPEVTTPPIQPGTTHTFEFPIIQSGTYWYHSHTHLQEQQGLYGAIVIQPKSKPRPVERADREQVLLISDWTNEDPDDVYRNLVRGSEYYSVRKGTTQSLMGAWKAGSLRDFFERERIRMRPMDLSDVAYDAFLINGLQHSKISGKPGERIRLRLVNGSASTYFYVTSSTGPLTLVAADGMPVKPVTVDRLLMAIGETYDALITLPANGQYEIRATAQDGSGSASAFIGEGQLQAASDPPLPNLYSMDHMLEATLDEEAAARYPRPSAPYALLQSPTSTRLPKNRKINEVDLHLTGDMERYVWSFNNRTAVEESIIPVRKGEILRLQMVNDTMMHHPIHLHGFFFRLVNQHGDRSPLKHTVDMPPMSRRTIEFEANETGDWMFHCHLLYHMMAGMSRVVAVRDETPALPLTIVPASKKRHSGPVHSMSMTNSMTMAHSGSSSAAAAAVTEEKTAANYSHSSHHGGNPWQRILPKKEGIKQAEAMGVNLGEHAYEMVSLWGEASVQSHLSEGILTARQGNYELQLWWEAGWQNTNSTEYEADAVVERYFNPNFRAFAGARLTNHDDEENRAIAGVHYRLPYMIWSSLAVDSEGGLRAGLSKSLQLTNRLAAFAEVQYDTNSEWEWDAGLEYTISQSLSLTTQYSSEYGFGGGVVFRF